MGRFSLPESELTRLVGTYAPPRVSIGDELQCEIRGMVVVRGWHDAPIMWPLTWESRKRPGLIVTGDLIRALQNESVEAVRVNWQVGRTTLARWKSALKIGATRRTKEIRQIMCESMAHDDFANNRRRESITPERLEKLHAHPRGAPTEEESRQRSERMTGYLLSLPICTICRQRRTAAHAEEHKRIHDYAYCRQCGGRWITQTSERPNKCKRCSRTDWDRYPCPACGQIETDEHVLDHLRRVGAGVIGPVGRISETIGLQRTQRGAIRILRITAEMEAIVIPHRVGEWRICTRCKAIRPEDLMRGNRCAICTGEKDSRPRPCPSCGSEIFGYRRRKCSECIRKLEARRKRQKYALVARKFAQEQLMKTGPTNT